MCVYSFQLKHTTTLFSLSVHYILSREWRVIVDQVPIIMVGLWCYNQLGVTELLILMDPHYGGMCFKSVKSIGTLSQLWKGPLPSASAFSTAKNVELLGSYPMHTLKLSLVRLMYLQISSKLHIGM